MMMLRCLLLGHDYKVIYVKTSGTARVPKQVCKRCRSETIL